MKEYIVGIEIGSSKICAAMGKIDKQGNLQIIGVTSVKCCGVRKSTVVDIDSTSEAIRKCKEQLEAMTEVPVEEAYMSIPGGLCELEHIKGVVAISADNREIAHKDVERVINTAKIISVSSDKEIIGVIPEQFTVDGCENITDPVGMTGIRLEVDAAAVIAQSTVVNNLTKSMEVAGLNTEGFILQPLAQVSLVSDQEEKKMCFALVDVGADTIDLCIYKGGNICYTNLIPLGGNTITNDIAKCLKISFSEAENLKNTFGTLRVSKEGSSDNIVINSAYNANLTIGKDLLVEIIRARVEEFFDFIQSELQNSGYYDEISVVMVTGGGISMFKGVSEMGREVFGKAVNIIAPKYAGLSSPSYSTSVGIVKSVFESMKHARTFSGFAADDGERVLTRSDYKTNKIVSKIKDLLEEFF
jgi:cell division protein FtsA